jgi:hypothetical protein
MAGAAGVGAEQRLARGVGKSKGNLSTCERVSATVIQRIHVEHQIGDRVGLSLMTFRGRILLLT